jgi:MOB kinase activator 1
MKLPAGESLNDWLAVSVVDFFNQLPCLFAPVAEFCTGRSCPEMAVGPGFKYYWQDAQKYKKRMMLAAKIPFLGTKFSFEKSGTIPKSVSWHQI